MPDPLAGVPSLQAPDADLVDEELAAWLRLLLTPGVGRAQARRLLAAFGSAQAIFADHGPALHALSPALLLGLHHVPDAWTTLQRATARWLESGAGRQVVTLADPGYPRALLDTADPPLLLYAQGRLALSQTPCVAIVGSRKPTPQGRDNARHFAAELARAGLVVVSGLAQGIDGAAHQGALQAGGLTIAVVGTGLDRVYPRAHSALAERVAESGLLLSEYPLGTPPLAVNFPIRNRIIAGLSQATLVVEAAVRSGSLSTARLAAEAGRDVMAIPGSIHSPLSRGCHALIRQGAKLVECVADVLDELKQPDLLPRMALPTSTRDEQPASEHDPLLAALGHDPVTLDALQERTGFSVAKLNAQLLELELQGRVARLPGGLFQRRSRG